MNQPTLIPSFLLTRYDRLLRSGGSIPSLMDCLSEGERDRYEVGVSCLLVAVRPTSDCGGLALVRHSRYVMQDCIQESLGQGWVFLPKWTINPSKQTDIHPIPDIRTTFVPAKMVHISEKSIKQKAI